MHIQLTVSTYTPGRPIVHVQLGGSHYVQLGGRCTARQSVHVQLTLLCFQFLFFATNIGLFGGYFNYYANDEVFFYLNEITGVSLRAH